MQTDHAVQLQDSSLPSEATFSFYEFVKQHFDIPLTPYPFQANAVESLAYASRSALYFEPGLGKTLTSTVCALYHKLRDANVVLVLMPPILLSTWARWLAKVKYTDGRPLRVVVYRGSPKERKALNLMQADFVLMSMNIFKNDYPRITSDLCLLKVHTILDEAQCIKDVGTQNYKRYRDFVDTQSHQLLTGTPLNNPMDAYAYIKLVSPNRFMNLAQFERTFVYERDFFDKPTKFHNLELLQDCLMLNADRKTKEEVLLDLPACIIVPIEYELDPKHSALYKTLAEEQLLKLPDGDKLDLTQATALYHALGQIVMQWHHFGQDEALKSAGYDVLDEVLDELGDKKLVVFANYRRTNAEIQRRYNCPGVWGEVTAKDKQLALDRFIEDPKCRLITMAPRAGGVGVDGLQHVCADVLYVEPPIAVMHLTQSLSRVHRDGQKEVVTVRLATALGTIQQHLVKSLSDKEALVNPIQGSKALLRAALFGG